MLLPHESTFSRAFAEFAQSELPQRLHRAFIEATHGTLLARISRDSTDIAAREGFSRADLRPHPRRNRKSTSQLSEIFEPKSAPEMTWAEQDRYKERSTVERVHARLKDEFGARNVRVRGRGQGVRSLTFGLIALTVDQLLNLTASANSVPP